MQTVTSNGLRPATEADHRYATRRVENIHNADDQVYHHRNSIEDSYHI
jgi:hypothetical protein